MPARKPSSLIQRHETAAEKAERAARESALQPARRLPVRAPAQLHGHPLAEAAWRRLMRTYGELEAEIVTRLDQDLLVDYCLLAEQVIQIDKMRQAAYQIWLELSKEHERLVQEEKFDDAVLIGVKVVGAFDAIVKLDGRADRKRDLLFKLRQSLYLTPRARAGTAPKGKEEETPPDDLELLLNDVTDFVNREGGHA
jgi:phage terminase small subunit